MSVKDVAPWQKRLLDSRDQSDAIRVVLLSDGAGVVGHEGRPQAVVALHVGRPVRLACRHCARLDGFS